jgi:hypothetical protein
MARRFACERGGELQQLKPDLQRGEQYNQAVASAPMRSM